MVNILKIWNFRNLSTLCLYEFCIHIRWLTNYVLMSTGALFVIVPNALFNFAEKIGRKAVFLICDCKFIRHFNEVEKNKQYIIRCMESMPLTSRRSVWPHLAYTEVHQWTNSSSMLTISKVMKFSCSNGGSITVLISVSISMYLGRLHCLRPQSHRLLFVAMTILRPFSSIKIMLSKCRICDVYMMFCSGIRGSKDIQICSWYLGDNTGFALLVHLTIHFNYLWHSSWLRKMKCFY